MPSISFGSRIRKSPYFEAAKAAGAENYTIYNRMYMPTGYGDPDTEYWRIINDVSIWDVAAERQVELVGPDAAKLSALMTPRDLSTCAIGQGRYAPMCDHNGRLINDPIMLKLAEDRFWMSIADSDMLYWARAIAGEKNFDVNVFEPDASPLAVQGPKANDAVADLVGDWVRDLKYFWFKETEIEGIPVVVQRSGWSKQGGFELYLTDGSKGFDLYNIVSEAIRPYGGGPGAPNTIERVESGLISFGTDTDDATNPIEMNLQKFLNIDQNVDYIGKPALQKIAADGPKRHFKGLVIEGDALAPTEHKVDVLHNEAKVGFSGVALHSKRLDKNIALCLVDNSIDESEELTIQLPDGPRRAQQSALPFC